MAAGWRKKGMFMKKAMFSAVALALAVTLVAGYARAGQPKYTLKFNHVQTSTEPYHLAWEEWAKAVEERTNGEVRVYRSRCQC